MSQVGINFQFHFDFKLPTTLSGLFKNIFAELQ